MFNFPYKYFHCHTVNCIHTKKKVWWKWSYFKPYCMCSWWLRRLIKMNTINVTLISFVYSILWSFLWSLLYCFLYLIILFPCVYVLSIWSFIVQHFVALFWYVCYKLNHFWLPLWRLTWLLLLMAYRCVCNELMYWRYHAMKRHGVCTCIMCVTMAVLMLKDLVCVTRAVKLPLFFAVLAARSKDRQISGVDLHIRHLIKSMQMLIYLIMCRMKLQLVRTCIFWFWPKE